MLEGLCRPSIYDKCLSVTGSEPLVQLRGRKKHEWDWNVFYQESNRFSVYEKGYVRKLMVQPSRSPLRLASSLFTYKGYMICDGYVKDRFDSWESAMKEAGTFNRFVEAFEVYFKERKVRFMEKTDELIEQFPKQLTKTGKIRTNSHGGVANLLKVLTKTMHEQGSSIRTIAKVQYAICTQAGIYVPDEFITDVLVAADINPDVFSNE